MNTIEFVQPYEISTIQNAMCYNNAANLRFNKHSNAHYTKTNVIVTSGLSW